MDSYGMQLSLDIHNCDIEHFNRRDLKIFFKQLCEKIDMVRGKISFWDYFWCPWERKKAPPHLNGTSVVQFIQTSSIVIHTLDDMERVYFDLFSCKDFSEDDVVEFAEEYFNGNVVHQTLIIRD